jgi:hypothetical protein
LVDFCQKWRDADEELADRVAAVEMCWMNTMTLLELIECLHPVLNDQIRRIFENSLAVLGRKLDLAVVQAQKLQDPRSVSRPGFLHLRRKAKGARYALYESTLDAAIQDLETWERRCMVAMDLNMRDPNPVIDERLKRMRETQHGPGRKSVVATKTTSPLSLTGGIRDALRPTGPQPSVFLPNMPLQTSAIPFSRARLACRQASYKTQWFVLDTLPCRPQTDIQALSDDVRTLALKLRRADPFAFGLLTCKGALHVLKQPPQADHAGSSLAGFDLVFHVPQGTDSQQLQSLRALVCETSAIGPISWPHPELKDRTDTFPEQLLAKNGAPSLSRRVRLAQELATSVSYVHTFNFVHKNICPESVLLIDGGEQQQQALTTTTTRQQRTSFLIGFESFRSVGGKTSLAGDEDWAANLYRHPERMSEFPAEEYRMQHDIYSLGVCLLEIGLWEPLVEYGRSDDDDDDDDTEQMPVYGRVCREFARMQRSWVFLKDFLVGLAKEELPRKMGDRYAEVVVTCLTCLDRDGDFGEEDEGADADGILVGVRFIETIFAQLNEIVL